MSVEKVGCDYAVDFFGLSCCMVFCEIAHASFLDDEFTCLTLNSSIEFSVFRNREMVSMCMFLERATERCRVDGTDILRKELPWQFEHFL